jgi:hypothetical protein
MNSTSSAGAHVCDVVRSMPWPLEVVRDCQLACRQIRNTVPRPVSTDGFRMQRIKPSASRVQSFQNSEASRRSILFSPFGHAFVSIWAGRTKQRNRGKIKLVMSFEPNRQVQPYIDGYGLDGPWAGIVAAVSPRPSTAPALVFYGSKLCVHVMHGGAQLAHPGICERDHPFAWWNLLRSG